LAKDRNQQRRENYKKLREAGFSKQEADRFKGSKPDQVTAAIRVKQLPPVDPVKRAASRGQKKETIKAKDRTSYTKLRRAWEKVTRPAMGVPPQPMSGRIQYTQVEPPLTMNYLSNYTYKMAFMVRHPDGNYEWRYITITSDEMETRRNLRNIVIQEVFGDLENQGKYDTRPLISTLTLVEAFKRE